MNKGIRVLEDKIITTLNQSSVEIEVKRLILQNILNLVMQQADKAIIAETVAENKAKEEQDAESA